MKRLGKQFSKVLAAALCLVLALQVFPATALAADSTVEHGVVVKEVEAQRSPLAKDGQGALEAETADPEETIEMIVELEDKPVSAAFPASFGSTTLQGEAAAYQAVLSDTQSRVQAAIQRTVDNELQVTYSYTQLFNGFAVKTARKNLPLMESIPGVKAVHVAGTYAMPNPEAGEQSAAALANTMNQLGYTGEGLTVAVIDCGLDLAHPAFDTAPKHPSYNRSSISMVLKELKAFELMPGLTEEDVYRSEKVPFAFDYGMKDADPVPADTTQARALAHGTHVAGIIGGYDVDEEGTVLFSGVAPDAQIIAMKVFDDYGASASDVDVMAALEDAYALRVDVVNLSLGRRSGFTAGENTWIESVYEKMEDAGILVVVSAGNDTSSSYMNRYGENLPLAQDPDNGIVGSPSTYPSTLSVASVNGETEYHYCLTVGQEQFPFTDSTNTVFDIPARAELLFSSGYLAAVPESPYEFVVVPGVGAWEDYWNEDDTPKLDVAGKIAVIQRGEISFAEKVRYAGMANAVGVIVYNHDAEHPDDYMVNMDVSGTTVPACFVSYNAGQALIEIGKANETATQKTGISFSTELHSEASAVGGEVSSFSSIGVTGDLRLKPEISGIGGNVKSTVPTMAGTGGYEVMSGTSMASPWVAGISALVLQRLQAEDSPLYQAAGPAAVAEMLLMSTADMVMDGEVPYSPRLQGSGLANAEAALTSPVYLYTDSDSYGDTKPVVNLGDDPEETGSYTIRFHAANMSDADATYALEVLTMAPEYLERDGYALMGDTGILLDCGLEGDTTVTVPAGGVQDIAVTVTLSEEARAYVEQFENGIYVEGFVCLSPVAGSAAELRDLSLPYLGFYGDWSKAGMLDYADFLDDLENTPYSSAYSGIGAYVRTPAIDMGFYLGANIMTNVDVPFAEEHIVVSPNEDGCYDCVELVSLALLRNAKDVTYTVTDAEGNEVWKTQNSLIPKTSYVPGYGAMVTSTNAGYGPEAWYGVNNAGSALPDGPYYYTITATPLMPEGRTESHNVRDTLTFPVYVDTQAPALVTSTITLREENGRFWLGLPVRDEHMLMAVSAYPITEGWYGLEPDWNNPLLDNATGEGIFGLDGVDVQDAVVEVDVTDYAGGDIYFEVNDWGYNSRAYQISVPAVEPETELSLSPENLLVPTGQTGQLLCVNNQALDDLGVSWSSADETVATVTADGLVTGVSPGQTEVTATAANGAHVSCLVGVYDPLECTGIRLAYTECTMQPKMHPQLPTVYLEPYGFVVPAQDVTWTSDSPEVADMSYGVSLHTETVGTAVVTATVPDMDESFSATLTVHVEDWNGSVNTCFFSLDIFGPDDPWYLYPTGVYMYTEGDSSALYAYDEDYKQGDMLTYSVDNEEVLSLDKFQGSAEKDNEDGPHMTALKAGVAHVTATAQDGDSFTWTVFVEPKRYEGIETVQTPVTLYPGDTFSVLDAVALLGEGVFADENPVFFRSFQEDVATVDENGLLTAHQEGSALIWVFLNTGAGALVRVDVAAPPAVLPDFSDVDPDAWYGEAVAFVVQKGLMEGVGQNLFAPFAKLSRGQLVTILYRMSGEPEVTGKSPFTDVPEGRFFSHAVSWASASGIVKGVSNTRFAPNANVTRQDMLVMLYRYAQLRGVQTDAPGGALDAFPDASKVAGYAEKAVAWAVESNLVNGIGQPGDIPILAPRDASSRAQVATVIMRFVKYLDA